MKFTQSYSYPAAVDAVYGLVTDETFRSEACERQGALEHDVSVTAQGDGHVVTIKRTMPAQMPDFVKKITGDTVKVVQTETWGPADASGNRAAEVAVEIVGQPAHMKGSASLTGGTDATEFLIDGDVKVSIPLLGRKIEPEVAKAVKAALDADVAYGTTKL